MPVIPSFRLYASNGTTLVHTFEVVQYTNAPSSPKRIIIIEGQRGVGCLTIDGGEACWDLILRGIIVADDYEALTTKIDSMQTDIVINTGYVLKFDKTDSTVYSYNVKLLEPITYSESLRTGHQEYTITLKANSW